MPDSTNLVVNHDPLFLELMTILLEDEGYRTLIRQKPEDAYRAAKAEHPDLVLLDLHLTDPQPSWTVLDLIRLDPATATIPVIVSSTDERFLPEKETTLREQNVECLVKPFNLAAFLAPVRRLIGSEGGPR